LCPWLRKLERAFQSAEDKKKKSPASKDTEDDPAQNVEYRIAEQTKMDIPEELLNKIHFYNVMLQLSLPSSAQRPLIDSLVGHMCPTNLNAYELETHEMTVGRFYSQGVPVLYPVLCHFVGTYPLRRLQDRQNLRPLEISKVDDGHDKQSTDQGEKPEAPTNADVPPQDATKGTGKATTAGINKHWNLTLAFDFGESDRRYLDFTE
jgi:hypothetical protein